MTKILDLDGIGGVYVVRYHLRKNNSLNKIYETAIQPAMIYGGECLVIRKYEQNQFNTTEMKIAEMDMRKINKRPLFELAVTIHENAHIKHVNTFLTKEI